MVEGVFFKKKQMLLTILKILTTLLTAGLAVFAVTTDFTDKETKKLKPAGRWYIGFFLLSVALSFTFDSMSDNEKDNQFRKLLGTETQDLNSVQKIFDQVNSITAPVAPIQIVFRIRYPLKNAILKGETGAAYYSTGQKVGDGFGDWVPIVQEYDDRNNHHHVLFGSVDDDLLNPAMLRDSFFKSYISTFEIYLDSGIQKPAVKYCTFYNYCGKMYDNLFYEKRDSCLIRETTITCNNTVYNSGEIVNLQKLVDSCYLRAVFGQGGRTRFSLNFRRAGRQDIDIESCILEPFVRINYWKNFSLQIDMENKQAKVKPQELGTLLSRSILIMKLKSD